MKKQGGNETHEQGDAMNKAHGQGGGNEMHQQTVRIDKHTHRGSYRGGAHLKNGGKQGEENENKISYGNSGHYVIGSRLPNCAPTAKPPLVPNC